jgi:Winged helix DNA-binding domain
MDSDRAPRRSPRLRFAAIGPSAGRHTPGRVALSHHQPPMGHLPWGSAKALKRTLSGSNSRGVAADSLAQGRRSSRAKARARMSLAEVCGRRLERHSLCSPVGDGSPAAVASAICGAHAQVLSAAELSIGLRASGITRGGVRDALWRDRSLTETLGPRGTVHLLATSDLPLWIGALQAIPPPRSSLPAEIRLSAQQTDTVVDAIERNERSDASRRALIVPRAKTSALDSCQLTIRTSGGPPRSPRERGRGLTVRAGQLGQARAERTLMRAPRDNETRCAVGRRHPGSGSPRHSRLWPQLLDPRRRG